jgi:site-specific recombinase XerD
MPRKSKQKKHRGVFERLPGSNIWWCRFIDVDGKRKSRMIGAFSDTVNFYEEQKVRIRKRIIAPVPSHRGIRYTDLVDAALIYSKANHTDTRNFSQRLEVTREQFGGRQAGTITTADVAAWFAEMEFTPATQNRYRAAMSKAFKLAIQDGKVSLNPVRLVPQKKESVGRLRYLTDEEEVRLRKAIAGKPYTIPQLDIALHTGMRMTEQFTVTFDQVNLVEKNIHLNKTKNGSSRYVSLNSEAIRALKHLQAEHERLELGEDATLFFSHRNVPMANPSEWFETACKDAGTKGVTWHTLRHTFASRLVMAGVGLKTVQELMGHKTISMTARYAHLSPGHKLAALEMLV